MVIREIDYSKVSLSTIGSCEKVVDGHSTPTTGWNGPTVIELFRKNEMSRKNSIARKKSSKISHPREADLAVVKIS